MARNVIRPHRVTIPVTFRGPHPLAEQLALAVDQTAALSLSGRSGHTRVGMSGNPYNGGSFRGDLGPLQRFGQTGARVTGHGLSAVNMRPPDRGVMGLPGKTKLPTESSGADRIAPLNGILANLRGLIRRPT